MLVKKSVKIVLYLWIHGFLEPYLLKLNNLRILEQNFYLLFRKFSIEIEIYDY